uniref:Multidrug and toxin extrusion protein n=1 Tax=Varanus komodoensis TaxID=61221 RepID=A0A8D2L3Q5_VARKO
MSQTYGSKNVKRVGTILQRGVVILLLFCFPCWAVFINTERILLLCKQDPEVSRSAGAASLACAPEQVILLPQVVTGVVANVLNVGMNAVFLHLLELGVVGSAWANTLSQNLQAILLFLYVWCKKIHKETWGGWTLECLQEWGSFIRLALPSMLMICIEWWTFEIGGFMAGMVSVVELGAQSIIYELATIAYLLPQGMSVACSVRIGNALGAGDAEQARKSCVTGLLCTGAFAVVFAGLLGAMRNVVAYIFTSDREIVALVAKVMLIFAPFHLFDAIAATCGGVLRGAGKQKIGAIANAVGYYVIGLPIGISLMFQFKLGVMGLWSGLIVCISLQAVSFLVFVLRADWKKAAEEAQIRAGLTSRLPAPGAEEDAANKPVPLGTFPWGAPEGLNKGGAGSRPLWKLCRDPSLPDRPPKAGPGPARAVPLHLGTSPTDGKPCPRTEASREGRQHPGSFCKGSQPFIKRGTVVRALAFTSRGCPIARRKLPPSPPRLALLRRLPSPARMHHTARPSVVLP